MIHQLDEQQELVARTVREFVDREVIPVASDMEHRNEYPHALVETMKGLGLFGLNMPDEYGGNEVDYTTFAIVFEELSRGWMGLAGILGTHLVLCDVLARYGTTIRSGASCLGWRKANRAAASACRSRTPGPTCSRSRRRAARRRQSTASTARRCGSPTAGRAQIFLLLAKTDPDGAAAASRHQRVRHRKGRRRSDRRP